MHKLTFQNLTNSGLQMFGSNLQAPAVGKKEEERRMHRLPQFAQSPNATTVTTGKQ